MLKRNFNLILMLCGALIAIASQYFKPYEKFLVSSGMVILFVSLYRISKKLSSREDSNDGETIPDDDEI